MVLEQYQPQHKHQLPHHKCMWSLLLAYIESGTQRQRGIQSFHTEQTGHCGVINDAECQRYSQGLTIIKFLLI